MAVSGERAIQIQHNTIFHFPFIQSSNIEFTLWMILLNIYPCILERKRKRTNWNVFVIFFHMNEKELKNKNEIKFPHWVGLCCAAVGRCWQEAKIHKKYPFTFDGPSFLYIKGYINETKSISPLIHRNLFHPRLHPLHHLYIQILLKKFEFYEFPFQKA